MTDIPQLTTDRLVLRGTILADFASYAAFYASDATEFISGPLTEGEAWQMFASDAGHWALKSFGWWTITENGTPVGAAGLHHPVNQDDVEIGWNVYAGVRGRGIGREAAEAALDWAANALRPARLVSYISDGNAASIALAERLGATRLPDRARHDKDKAIYLHDLARYAK